MKVDPPLLITTPWLASEYTNDINANIFPQNFQHVEGYIQHCEKQYSIWSSALDKTCIVFHILSRNACMILPITVSLNRVHYGNKNIILSADDGTWYDMLPLIEIVVYTAQFTKATTKKSRALFRCDISVIISSPILLIALFRILLQYPHAAHYTLSFCGPSHALLT